MKTIIYSSLILFGLLASCKKDSPVPDSAKLEKYPVSFRVDGFSKGVTKFAKLAVVSDPDSIKTFINYLFYFVVNPETGRPIKSITQVSTDKDFGVIRDTLEKGRYMILIVGSKDSITAAFNRIDFVDQGRDHGLGTDVFYQKSVISVEGAVTQAMLLDRKVSRVSLHISDNIPSNAGAITIAHDGGVEGDDTYMNPYTERVGSFKFVRKYLTEEEKGQPYTLTYYTFDTGSIDMRVNWEDGEGNILGGKDIFDVPMETNKSTMLNGKLFDFGGNGEGTTVGLNTDYVGDLVVNY